MDWEEGVNQEIVFRLRLKFTNPQNCNLVVTNSMHPLTHKICFLSESERQFQRSTSRGEGEDATSPPRQHYSQAATARYLIMRKATKKSLKVSEWWAIKANKHYTTHSAHFTTKGGHSHLGCCIFPSKVALDSPSFVCQMQLLKANKYGNLN